MSGPFQFSGVLAAFLFAAGTVAAGEGETLVGQAVALDGDTILLQRAEQAPLRVRLFGVDAPEMNAPCGRLSRAILDRISRDKPVTCRALDRDRYKRTVAQCWVEGDVQPMGALLIEQGGAVPARQFTYGDKAPVGAGREYDRAELVAILDEAGLWGNRACW